MHKFQNKTIYGALGREPHPGGEQELATLEERCGILELADRDPPHRLVEVGGAGAHHETEVGECGDVAQTRRHGEPSGASRTSLSGSDKTSAEVGREVHVATTACGPTLDP